MNLKDILAKATHTAYPEPDSPVHCDIIPKVVEVFKEYVKPPATILDVGCGSCFGAKTLRDAGYTVRPISILPQEVEAAKARGFDAEICEMHDTDNLGGFDAVWLRHAAEHSPCPLLLLSNLRSQADWLYMEVPMPLTSARHDQNPNHYSCLTDLNWMNILKVSGWEIQRSQIISLNVECGPDVYMLFICK